MPRPGPVEVPTEIDVHVPDGATPGTKLRCALSWGQYILVTVRATKRKLFIDGNWKEYIIALTGRTYRRSCRPCHPRIILTLHTLCRCHQMLLLAKPLLCNCRR